MGEGGALHGGACIEMFNPEARFGPRTRAGVLYIINCSLLVACSATTQAEHNTC